MRHHLRSLLKRTGLLPYLGLARDALSARSRQRLVDNWRALQALRQALKAYRPAPAVPAKQTPAFLVYGVHDVTAIVAMLPVLLAARSLGYRLWVLLPIRDPLVRRGYQLCGVRDFIYLDDQLEDAPHPKAAEIQAGLSSADDLKPIVYKDCRIGKFCLSTLMRLNRMGDPDIADPQTAAVLRVELSRSLRAADAAERIVQIAAPKLALLSDRGYSPYGEIFDTVLARGGECVTWNSGHRNNILMLKRYHRDNVDASPVSLSDASWERMRQMPWSEANWHQLRDEIVGGYESGEWYSECATQFDKSSVEHGALIRRLGLDPSRKTVGLFPHMFWDATFFWGTDLFENYEQWFVEVLKVAAENRAVNWVVKVHPANIAKAIRDGYRGEYSEILAIRRTLGELPDHIKVIPPDSDISTLSLLSVLDFCLTVRGTIGIEAGSFGIRTLTAGTGRYDGRGFTMDYTNIPDYLRDLRRLPDLPAMTPVEIELARRFGYGLFMARPAYLTSTKLGFRRSLAAQMEAKVLVDATGQIDLSDVRSIAEWLASGDEDYLAPGIAGKESRPAASQ